MEATRRGRKQMTMRRDTDRHVERERVTNMYSERSFVLEVLIYILAEEEDSITADTGEA